MKTRLFGELTYRRLVGNSRDFVTHRDRFERSSVRTGLLAFLGIPGWPSSGTKKDFYRVMRSQGRWRHSGFMKNEKNTIAIETSGITRLARFISGSQKRSTLGSVILFLISSALTPATLAAGQTTCLLATQIKVMTPLAADSAGWTVVSDSLGNCVARSVDEPLRPVASRQTSALRVAMKKPSTVALAENLLSKLGWTTVDFVVDSSRSSYLPERAENAVARF